MPPITYAMPYGALPDFVSILVDFELKSFLLWFSNWYYSVNILLQKLFCYTFQKLFWGIQEFRSLKLILLYSVNIYFLSLSNLCNFLISFKVQIDKIEILYMFKPKLGNIFHIKHDKSTIALIIQRQEWLHIVYQRLLNLMFFNNVKHVCFQFSAINKLCYSLLILQARVWFPVIS